MFFYVLAQLVSWISNILIIVLLARSVLSWFVFSGYRRNTQLNKLYKILLGVTEPFVAPVRRFLSRFIRPGPFDLAPLATFFLIMIVSRILIWIFFGLSRVMI